MSDESVHLWDDQRAAGLVRSAAAGEPLFREGDPADGAYVLLSGHCAVLEGDEHVNMLHPGDLFGEIGALGGTVRTATVVAVDDAELLFLSTDQLHDGLISSPDRFWQSLRLIVDRMRLITHRQTALRDEHKALRDVQRSLLPDLSSLEPGVGFRATAVWEPCTYASGDYYDVIALDDDRHLIALGDVMGHGAESSLMMAIARAEIRELARGFRSTDELLVELDLYLRNNAPTRQGMSLVVAVYDRRDRLLQYSAAGHPFPFLLRDGELTDLPGKPGLLLALPFLIGRRYERCELELSVGDRVLLFTDGFFEVQLEDAGAHLGREGLGSLFQELADTDTDDLLPEMLRRIAAIDTAEHADDDRTAVLLTID